MGINKIRNNIEKLAACELIEHQHREIERMLLQLEVDKTSLSPKEFAKVLSEFNDLLFEHFDTEKKFMTEINYPEKDNHIKAHLDLISKVSNFNKNYNRYITHETVIEFFETIKVWFQKHEIKMDRKFDKYTKAWIKRGFNALNDE